MTLTNWMRECAPCLELIKNLEAASGGDTPPLRQFEEVRAHLVEAHLDRLPGYAEDCANCQEWAVLSTAPDGLPPKVVPVLGREALLHRAGHLLYTESAP